jgi:flagellar hook protein FlgE
MSMIETPLMRGLARVLDLSAFRQQLIASNLANVDTPAYKDQQVRFSDLFYQTVGSNGAGDPIQQGAGTMIGSIPSLFTQGNVNPTGVATDVAIMGGGFFIVEKDGVRSYSRAGNFEISKDNLLETSAGQQVLGYSATNGVLNTQGLVPLELGAGTISPASATTEVQLSTNLNATAAVGTTYSTPITIYDSLGASHNLMFTFTKTGTNAWDYSVSIPAADVGGATDPTVLTTGSLTFDGNGRLTSPTANISPINITGFVDGANDLAFSWNVFDAANNGLLTQMAAPSSTASTQQDGGGSGALVNFNIGSDGTITGAFSNGKTAILGQIALATFADNQGLVRIGNNDFTPTLASGQPVVGGPGNGGRGTLSGGALEQSNVDIAQEFASLIIAQRGYEANARCVTTFDQVAQDTINLKQ